MDARGYQKEGVGEAGQNQWEKGTVRDTILGWGNTSKKVDLIYAQTGEKIEDLALQLQVFTYFLGSQQQNPRKVEMLELSQYLMSNTFLAPTPR